MEAFVSEHSIIVISALIILPLFAFLVRITFGRRFLRQGNWISIFLTACAFSISIIIMVLLILQPDSVFLTAFSFPWFYFGNILIEFSFIVSGKAIFILAVVFLISTMVQIVAIKKFYVTRNNPNYIAYLLLLSFASAGAVLSDNLICMFLFWELIGISTCLLIGLNFEKKSSSTSMVSALPG